MTKVFHLIGGKWKSLILFLIQNNVNRFGALKKCMPKISRKVLTHQLRELEKDELICRHVHEATPPQVVVYHLTEKGVSARQLIDSMIQWGLIHFRKDYSEELLIELVRR